MCDVNYKLKIWLTKEIENYELVHVLQFDLKSLV